MGVSSSSSSMITESISHRKHSTPFRDKFMYKFLARMLTSMQESEHFMHPNMTNIPHQYPHLILDYEVTTTRDLNANLTIDSINNRSDRNGTDPEYADSVTSTVLIIFMGTLLSILTTGGNLMVILAFKLERQLQTISNYFLFSLAVADLTIGIISIPLMTFYTAEGEWTLGYTTCQFWLCIDYLMSNASVMNLLLISFDRYFSVTRPLTYRPRRTSKKAMIMISSTFIISLILWPPLIIAWPHIEGSFRIQDNECIVQFLRTNPGVTVGTALVAFYGPVVIMIVLYSRVYYVTKTRQKELVKLQAFHQRSIKRTVSSNCDSRIPLRSTISTASTVITGQRKMSAFSKTQMITSECGQNIESDSQSMYVNNNNRTSPGQKQVKRVDSEAKPWGFQALMDHFTRPKPLSSNSSTRQASFASSGFEDEESLSAVSGDTMTYVGEEAVPLRRGVQKGQNTPSPSPSDYGSTLANQFINTVRQSFMIRRKSRMEITRILPKSRSRSMSNPQPSRLAKMASMIKHTNHGGDQHSNQKYLNVNTSDYDPQNSPIQELRHISAVARISAKCAGVTQSAPSTRLQATNEENEDEIGPLNSNIDPRPRRSLSASNTVYTVLIQLGKNAVDVPPAPPPPQLIQENGRKKSRHKPLITLYHNQAADYSKLSPDHVTSTMSSFSAADISSNVPSAIVRRISSCSSAVSESVTPPKIASPLIIKNRSTSQSSVGPSSVPNTPVQSLKRTHINRLSSSRSTGPNEHGGTPLNPAIAQGSSRRKRRQQRRYQESKAARTLSAILLAFIVTWAPYNFVVCIDTFDPHSVPVFWFTFSYYLCYLNSAINPLLYALCNATFRHTFWRIMTFKWTRRQHQYKRPHHQAAVALTAVAIAAGGTAQRQQQYSANNSMK